ncbi:MAG: twin-arginine translocase TatA/TatE family subunit [Candidatus Marinimicrobia bacterium]|nr:twin-arginine translocase TatA/TatE family subunit [Candidatus Neomarinimicrobiota bacterium]
MGIGWQEIILILVVVLLLFGAKRIPEVMRSVGKGINEFKKGMHEITSSSDNKDDKE